MNDHDHSIEPEVLRDEYDRLQALDVNAYQFFLHTFDVEQLAANRVAGAQLHIEKEQSDYAQAKLDAAAAWAEYLDVDKRRASAYVAWRLAAHDQIDANGNPS